MRRAASGRRMEPLVALTRSAASWCRLRTHRKFQHIAPRLAQAYASNLANRLPLLYCVVLFNIAVLGCSYWTRAPLFLTLGTPLALCLLVTSRAIHWLPVNVARRNPAEILLDLHRLETIGPLAAFACCIWALALYPYGDPARHALVHYVTAITCFTGILGLAQAPATAVRLALVTMIPATASIVYHQDDNWIAIAAIQLVVTGLLLLVTHGYHADFLALELSREELDQQKQKSTVFANLMLRRASEDALTGVSSRGAILDRLEGLLEDPLATPPWLALLDLDGFKLVNDTFGHSAGDMVLQMVCARIGEYDQIFACGRLGGDEFALLVDGERSAHEVREVLTRLGERLAEPIPYDGYALTVTASIGLRHTQRTSLSDCLERADEALYKAKRQTGNAVELFGADDEQAMRERAAVTRVFSSADLHSRIDLVYQPIFDVDAGATRSFEALARWSTDFGEIFSPETFIPLAESTGRIHELTRIVVERALRECPAWTFGARLSINLSAHDILREHTAVWLGEVVASVAAPPSAITFEITETALIADLRRAAANLCALRERGFEIALDDFGTGQSSLSHVHRLPLDHIKLDRTFANELETSRSGRAVAATVLALARQLDLSCSIEGIETATQAAAAGSLGFRLMQGYYFGRPLPAPLAMAALAKAA
jgi:diguanylate cyclase (GGDEF)-like protein